MTNEEIDQLEGEGLVHATLVALFRELLRRFEAGTVNGELLQIARRLLHDQGALGRATEPAELELIAKLRPIYVSALLKLAAADDPSASVVSELRFFLSTQPEGKLAMPVRSSEPLVLPFGSGGDE